MTSPGQQPAMLSRARRVAYRALPWFLGAALALGAGLLVLQATPYGLGLGRDSFYYLGGARGMLAGEGFARPMGSGAFTPITHFPPLYSGWLALWASLGFELPDAARWLAAVALAASTFVTFALLRWASGRELWPVLGAVLLGSAPPMIVVHSWALSEPLFLLFLLCGLGALASYLARGSRWALVAAGLLASLAYLTRYAGAALIVAGALAVLAQGARRNSWRRSLLDAVLFLATALPLPMWWSWRNARGSGTVANRVVGWHWDTLSPRLWQGAESLSQWLLPEAIPVPVRVVVLVGVVFFLGAVVLIVTRPSLPRSRQTGRKQALALSSALFIGAYAGILLATMLLLDAATQPDTRILSPFYPAGLLLGLIGWDLLGDRLGGRRALQLAGAIGLVAFTLLVAARGIRRAMTLAQDGQGFASRAWQADPLIERIQGLPEDVPIYTNELNALYLLAGRPAYSLPLKWDSVRGAPRADFAQNMQIMRRRLEEQGAVVVLFRTLAGQGERYPTLPEITEGLTLLYESDLGQVWGQPGHWQQAEP